VPPSRLLANTQTAAALLHAVSFETWGQHKRVVGVLCCVIGIVVPTFRNTVLSPASRRITVTCPDPENAGLLDNEDKGTTIPRNVPSHSAAPKKTSRPIHHSSSRLSVLQRIKFSVNWRITRVV